MKTLTEVRDLIDAIDQQMVKLFEERMRVVEDVVAYKLANDLPIFDAHREAMVIEKNIRRIKNQTYQPYYHTFIQQFMDISKDYQKSLMNLKKVGYQGTRGAFGHIATQQLYPNHPIRAYATFEEVFLAVLNQDIEMGVIPFENSFTGEVGEVLDLLKKYPLYINSMYELRVNHNLLGIKGSKIEDISQVYSHHQALSQCKEYLNGLEIEAIPYPNTALAAEYIQKEQDKSKAAIASKEIADLLGLEVLQASIQSSSQNTTKFIVVGKELSQGNGTKQNSGLQQSNDSNGFALVFTVNHESGQLAKVIQVIANHGFNMESIHSRALHDEPWKYYFFVEIAGSLEHASAMLEDMNRFVTEYKIVGAYQK